MREILFRGKKVSDGEWIYGMTISFGTIKRKSNDLFIENSEEKWCGIKKETFGQFTGLTDKNGVKIFEGDIVKYFSNLGLCDELYSEVKWGKNSHGWSLNTGYGKYYKLPSKNLIEVIGNIHDNPELLK